MKAVSGTNFIGFQESKKGTVTFHAFNPVTREQLPATFVQATPAEVNDALQLAWEAFGVFSELSPLIRAELLEKIARKLEENETSLTELFVLESGLPLARAKQELTRSAFQMTTFAAALRNGNALHAVIETGDPERLPAPKPDLRKMNVGLGPVAVFGAANFPFAYSTIGGDTGSALAAGCPVIVKGHPGHPHTSELSAVLIIEAVKEMGLPEGVFSHLHALDYSVGEQLVKDNRIKAVGFTGSFKGGMVLHQLAQSRKEPIPVFAEMSSVNPVVILPDALGMNTPVIAQKIAQSIAVNAGQFCTSPGLLFLVKNEKSDNFKDLLTTLLADNHQQVMLNSGIKENYESAIQHQLTGAEKLVYKKIDSDHSNAIFPSLVAISGKQFLSEIHRQDEVFGSFMQIVECEHLTELEACIAFLNGQLTASMFFSNPDAKETRVCAAILKKKVGRIVFNGVPTGVEVSPAMTHGGVFPATTDSRFTAVGPDAISRFMRGITFQNCPEELLPETLKTSNPLQILRFVNGTPGK